MKFTLGILLLGVELPCRDRRALPAASTAATGTERIFLVACTSREWLDSESAQ